MQAKTRTVVFLASLALVASMAACSDDDPASPQDSRFADLTEQEHVMKNLAAAYTEEDIAQMDRLLAADFKFFFSVRDLNLGLVDSVSWGKATELRAIENLFESAAIPPQTRVAATSAVPLTWGRFKEPFSEGVPSWPGAVQIVEMEILEHPDDAEWYPSLPEGSGRFYKDIWYYFTLEAEKWDYPVDINSPSRVVIEQNNVNGKLVWQLVEWHDQYGLK